MKIIDNFINGRIEGNSKKYDPVYEEATIISNNTDYFFRYVFIGLIVGFSMSFLLILFVTINKKV